MKDLQEVRNWKLDLELFREVFQEAKRSAKISVLVVEDCEEDFFLITRCLNAMHGYDVSITRARGLESARDYASRAAFDLAIIDYWLGEDTGPHVLRSLGGRGGKIPAILVTGLDHPAYKHAGLKAGAIHCMSKDMLTGTGLQDIIQGVLFTHRFESGEAREAVV